MFFCLQAFDAYSETLKYSLGDQENNLESASIISKRLNQARSIFEPEIEFTKENNIVYLLVDTKIAAKEYFSYLTTTQGKLEAFTVSDSKKDIWFTDKDIENTGTRDGSVDIRVTEEAAERIGNLYEKNKGKVLTVLLDSNVILKAKLTRPLGQSFRLRAGVTGFADDAEFVAILLRYGSLAKSVNLEKIVQ